jgi:hypothetical protein
VKQVLVALVLLSASPAKDFPLRAWLSLTKGDHGLGSYFVQIRIDRTVYISRDFCAEAGYLGGPYPAALNEHQTVVQLQAGKKICKYHIIDSRPYLIKGKPR